MLPWVVGLLQRKHDAAAYIFDVSVCRAAARWRLVLWSIGPCKIFQGHDVQDGHILIHCSSSNVHSSDDNLLDEIILTYLPDELACWDQVSLLLPAESRRLLPEFRIKCIAIHELVVI